jgi:hypothetical protein
MAVEPVVVGGTAEEYWTSDEYQQTDLDMCAPIGKEERALFGVLGFTKSGRHWENSGLHVAIEFPESEIDGEFARTELIQVGDRHGEDYRPRGPLHRSRVPAQFVGNMKRMVVPDPV